MLPNPTDLIIMELLRKHNPVSMNISQLPDGTYRTTIMRDDVWLKGYGTTPFMAFSDVPER